MPVASEHVVVVFARAPERGRVKTRLAATIGDVAALSAYRELAETVVGALAGGHWHLAIRCTPDAAVPAVAAWLGKRATVEPQGGGDLGERMSRAMADHFAAGARRVVIVGTDCPDVDAAVMRAAFDALDHVDVVFGPAHDGGYYLVGGARPVPAVFVDVPWSTPDTMEVSRARARGARYRYGELRPLGDIDTEADWRAWLARRRADGIT